MKGMERQEQGRNPCDAARKQACGNKIQHDHGGYAQNRRWQAYQEFAVTQPQRFRSDVIDALVFDAVFNADPGLRDAARWLIWEASQALGCPSASIHQLYMARGRGEFEPTRFTVPAINVRASAYLTARQAFTEALARDAGSVIFEIAKSEMAYTDQRPGEYTAVILASAIRTGWRGPVFLQGDHFQFNAAKWKADPDAEMAGLHNLTREALGAGFQNIDIDSSTLVDLACVMTDVDWWSQGRTVESLGLDGMTADEMRDFVARDSHRSRWLRGALGSLG